MTRKHFNALANALFETGASLETIDAVADICAASNPNFDRSRFVDAATEPAEDIADGSAEDEDNEND